MTTIYTPAIVYMANDNSVEFVTFDKEDVDDDEKVTIDEHLPVRGYGKHSGRKYWQLPDKIQAEIKRIVKAKNK